MLLDSYLPEFSFSERHSCRVDATPANIMRAVASYSPEDDRLFRVLIGLREAPIRLTRLLTGSTKPVPQQFGQNNFTLLEQNDSERVYGLIGQFWKPDFGLVEIADGTTFRAFGEPGIARLVLGFRAEADGSASRLTTETRVFCPDAASRRNFTPYWFLIRPFSGLIRRRILSSIKAASES